MQPVFQMSAGRTAAFVAAILFEMLYPLALALLVRRRLGVGWRYFGYGALIFVLFQLVTRVPLVQVAQTQLTPVLQSSPALQIGWGALLAITAGLSEEIGRYVGYRWLMGREEKTWAKAVMYGVGHGGIESIVLIGGLVTLSLINLLVLSSMDLGTLPPEVQDQVRQQLAAVAAQPEWVPLLGAWERLWTVIFHVAMSVLVLQVFRRGSMIWLWLAVVIHALVDFVALSAPGLLGLQGITALLATEGLIAIVGLIALWIIRTLREPPGPAPLEIGAGEA